jgi:hypothetical protein
LAGRSGDQSQHACVLLLDRVDFVTVDKGSL